MNPCRLFISQQRLDAWISEERAVLKDEELHDRVADQRYRLCEGVRFVAEVSGAPDRHELVGKVKDLDQIAALQGEHMADSVVLGDNAYQVQTGFVGTPLGPLVTIAPKATQDLTIEALQQLILGQIK